MLQERFLLPKQHLSERMSPPKRTNRPARLCRPHFQPSHPFHSPYAGVEGGGGVPEWTVWVMRKISGGDALEAGTVWQEKQKVYEGEGRKQRVEWWKTEGDRCQLPGDFRHDKQPSCLSDAQSMTPIQWAASHVVCINSSPTCLRCIRNPLRLRCLLLDIVLFRLIQWIQLKRETPERDEWIRGPCCSFLFFMAEGLRGQDLSIWAAFSFCWGSIMWSWTQINHQKTADPQNLAFGGFYTHITRNWCALWMVH